MLAAPVGVTFGVDDSGNITTTYDDALGDIADRRVVNLAESGTTMATNLAAASSGASSQSQLEVLQLTQLDWIRTLLQEAMLLLILCLILTQMIKSGFAAGNQVTFSVGSDGTSIDVKFDSQGTNSTTVDPLSYDADGSAATAVAREVLFKGSDLASAIAATTSGDSFVLTVNDGTSLLHTLTLWVQAQQRSVN